MADCLTCKWATWVMTKHRAPRINRKKAGTCEYPLIRIAFPSPLNLHSLEQMARAQADGKPFLLPHIWPSNPEANCRVWEKK